MSRVECLLIANPTAGRVRRSLASVAEELGLLLGARVSITGGRGDAWRAAERATQDGMDLVVVFGGDGTVNEVVNGLLGARGPKGIPLLAVLAGGATNVFARALGLTVSADGVAQRISDSWHQDCIRRVGLGRAGGRWFTMAAGQGLDAQTIASIEARRRDRGAPRTIDYLTGARRQVAANAGPGNELLTLCMPGDMMVPRLSSVIVQNGSPWTYLYGRGVSPCAEVSFDEGLAVVGISQLGRARALFHAGQVVSRRRLDGKAIVSFRNQQSFVVRSSQPVAAQVDGDYVGLRAYWPLAHVPDALSVLIH